MKSSRPHRPTIRRSTKSVPPNPSCGRHTTFSAGQMVTMLVSVGSLVFSGASAVFAWRQAQVAARAPIAQAVAVQQVQGCGEMIRTFVQAQNEMVSIIERYGGGSQEIPRSEAIRAGRAIVAAADSGTANISFFNLDQQSTVRRAIEVVANDRFIDNMTDDLRLQGIPAETAAWAEEHMDGPITKLQTMCRIVMYPQD